ncbi:MAG TPA: response regulator, partial [Nitrososphaeraceae archaeon]|nr:response regulator [Nitrososphaeraceae archaeon]
NNSYAPSTTHFGRSYNKGENKQDRSTSHVFLDHQFRSGNISTPRLVVDDEPDINLVVKKMLEGQRGFGVNSFDDSDLALRNFTSGLYDLLLLDIRTRNMNGIDRYNRIRKIDDNIKVCFMSANFYYYEEIRNRLVTLDEVNSSFLQNPFGIEELLQCVDKLIA